MTRRFWVATACLIWAGTGAGLSQTGSRPPVASRPQIIGVETSKGSFAFETYPEDAPMTVTHVVELVKRGFYDGQRVHRAQAGFVVQWGDPQSRDPAREAVWGRGRGASSGTPIGAAEISKKLTHVRGMVGISHPGNPALADSQIYITLTERKELNGRYTIFGRVISGTDVPERLQKGDLIRRMFVQE